jgi:hypothetical protein
MYTRYRTKRAKVDLADDQVFPNTQQIGKNDLTSTNDTTTDANTAEDD